MAEIVVSFLLDKISSLLQEELTLISGVRGEVVFIRDEFERMMAFLRAADHAMEDQEIDLELKVWVNQVRDVAYDTEAVLDEFLLNLAHNQRPHGCHGFPHKILDCVNNMKVRHRIGSKIRAIKSRIKDIAEGHQRYRYKLSCSDQSSSSNVVNTTWYDSRGDALLLEEAELVATEKPKHQLIEWLVEEDSRLKVVSVAGMGGLGKTTLVKKVYDDAATKKHFGVHAWLTVSESFKIMELLKDMIQQLFSQAKEPVPQEMETMNADRLKGIVKEFLQQKRYIVVFDDFWSIHAWNAIKHALPNTNSGSRVMLTTRSVQIASTCCIETEGNFYELRALSREDSWILFCRKAFRGSSCPPHLEELSQAILKRCEGLPLAIVAIGGVLATKNTIDEWESIHHSLGEDLEGNDELQGMKKIFSLSYNDLPYSLKLCWLYLSIFPEDHQINCMRLLRLWTAEGFVQMRDGKTLEDVAQSNLTELINRSLIQPIDRTYDGRPEMCRVHDLLRETILSKSREQNLVTVAAGRGDQRWPEKVRRLAIHSSLENVQEGECFNQLRSLLLFGNVGSLSKSSMSTLLRGRLLKVLDLSGAPLETIPNEVFKLFHLRYLSMQGTKVKTIPKLIGKLQKLETLDLKDTCVTELPVEILRLHRLRLLLLYHFKTKVSFHNITGFKAPSKIGSLLSLQHLHFIEADQTSDNNMNNIVVAEIGRLTQLRSLGIAKLRREDGMALCSSIEKLTNLRTLNVISIEEDEFIDLQSLSSAPRFLQCLSLRGRLEKLPHWIPYLHSLEKVHLKSSGLREDDDDLLGSLQVLPSLVELQLTQAYDGEGLCFKAGGFQKLKMLSLQKFKGLRWVRVEEGSMPHLEKLHFTNCKLLDELPSGIEHLTNLQLLSLSNMPETLIAKLQNRHSQGGDYRKIAHNLDLWIGQWKDGRWIGRYL